jgi:pyrroline-5-carboxylate reductase
MKGRVMKIGFIGIGNMGGAILNGLLAKGEISGGAISAFDVDREKLTAVSKTKGIHACDSIKEAVRWSDIIILGVKPRTFPEALTQAKEEYSDSKIVISMAAGVLISFIEGYLGSGAKIIRIMPNTPAMVGEGMTSVSRNKNINDEDMERALRIIRSVGKAQETPEELIHCVIGVSGSSPAYTYLYIEALVNGAVKNGMDRDLALVFAAQSVYGAAKMVLETGVSPNQLCTNVCSPGGTTVEAVRKLAERKFAEVVEAGLQAAVDKSIAMSE